MFDELNPEANLETGALAQPAQEPQQQTAPQETQKEYNLRLLRERAERSEQQLAELQNQMRMLQQPQKQKIEIVDDEDYGIDDESYAEGKHVKKIARKQKSEIQALKEKLDTLERNSSASNAELRLRAQYNDFDSVVNVDNIKKLASLKPSAYRSMLANPDLYDQGWTAYDLIKNSGIAEGYPEQDRRLEENRNKPRSSAGAPGQIAETPLTRVGDYDRRTLTPERKMQLLKQVEEAKKYR